MSEQDNMIARGRTIQCNLSPALGYFMIRIGCQQFNMALIKDMELKVIVSSNTKYILIIGNIGPLARIFELKIGNLQNILCMMGYSKLKLIFMLYLWPVGNRMTRR